MTLDDKIVVTWREIHRQLYAHKSYSALMRRAPELKACGVVGVEFIGRPQNRQSIAWTYPSMFKAWVVLNNQKRDKEREKDKKR